MRVLKRRWVAANFNTGEVSQVAKPTTKHKAIKIFKEGLYEDRFGEYEIFESWDALKEYSQKNNSEGLQ